MIKRDILVFTSPASAGKDFLLNKCVERFGWHKAVSHTTRPPRIGEQSGKDYYFVNPDKFTEYESNGEFLETTKYKTTNGTWYYGFHKDSIPDGNITCMILNPDGVNQMIDNGYADRMRIVYVVCDAETRIKRYRARLGDNPTEAQLAEGFLRLLRDIEDFDKFINKMVYIGFGLAPIYNYRLTPVIAVENNDYNFTEEALDEIRRFVEVTNG